jgi:von Hippel-Lindau disease tumor supressor
LAKINVSCADWKEAEVSPLKFALPVVVRPRKHTAELKGVKSQDARLETAIDFVNRSKQTIKVYWLDYDGARQLKGMLKDEDSYGLKRTFLTHPWLITDADDNAWYVFYPDSQPRVVEIHEPGLNDQAKAK